MSLQSEERSAALTTKFSTLTTDLATAKTELATLATAVTTAATAVAALSASAVGQETSLARHARLQTLLLDTINQLAAASSRLQGVAGTHVRTLEADFLSIKGSLVAADYA